MLRTTAPRIQDSWILLLTICLSPLAAVAQGPSLKIAGDVASPLELHQTDLAGMTRKSATITETDGTKTVYEGVPLRDVLMKAGVPFGKDLRGKALVGYIVAKAHDGYEVLFSLGEIDAAFGNTMILIADTRNGKALFDYQGPLRLICPADSAGARSVRMLESLEYVRLRK
jgi:hypothetical protein